MSLDWNSTAKDSERCRARPEYVAPEIVTGRELGSQRRYQVGLLSRASDGSPSLVGNNFRTTARRHALEGPSIREWSAVRRTF